MGGQTKGKKKSKARRKDPRSNGGSGLAGLSPQDRMKLKMQEKAKKKTAEKYTVEQLLEKTEECMDSLEFEMAGRFCQRALEVEPDNLLTLDLLGHIHSELGDTQRAKEVFLHAVQLSPEEGHSKYMSLGQIHTGQEAVQYYTKGVQILLCMLEKHAQATAGAGAEAAASPLQDSGSEIPIARHVCVAYCSVAEIYFTDLCMEERAGDQCREAIERALTYQPDNPEALQLMASYLFSTEKNQEGKEYLMRSVDAWLPALKQSEAPPSREDVEEEHTQSDIPPYESRITTAKLLIEAEEYETAVDVLEGLLEEDDEVVQVWYLSGWVCYLQMEERRREEREESDEEREECEALKEAARSYLTKAKKLYVKLHCDDGPILEHMEQLLVELGGETEGEEEETDPALDEDFEPSSDDEEEEEDAMEH
ncbi:probable assembly chaperone of rpl4 [Oncorhynchus tshawytscha]|uniref:probable assembly chaperone of rpl4 n=1 Tax=Oncorhynchus tshawytscha TaxID=74940 RepID=UPI000D09E393|nr:probable assembly chaperone of rpl4 [Oncorhynchus tshawytscha]XP_042166579.1 probable assembly chaperone of rpl4 [Oncorhynchus tshawytscha]